MNDQSFLKLIHSGITNNWDRPALSDLDGKTYLYKDFAQKIAELHILFDAFGIKKGDKIALCGRNSANWAIAFFASIGYGAVITTILHDFHSENIHNIATHSDSKLLLVSDGVWNRINPEEMPFIDSIMSLEDFSILKSTSAELMIADEELKELFDKKYPNGFEKENLWFHDDQPEEAAVLNYTSGTTSNPKGVILPYRSLWSNTKFAIDNIPFIKAGDGIVCMLPMAHMYGLAFEILLSIASGCHIHFLSRIPSPQIILDAFTKANPRIILAVPLIIEKIIQNKVFPELRKSPVKFLIKIPFFKKKIYAKISNKLLPIFGSNLEEIIIGGAALNKQVGHFLTDIKFPYTVGYGMTECGPLITYEYWKTYKIGSCGKAVDRMQIKIDSADPEKVAGEIMVKGTNVMTGYYKNEEATREILTSDGWLKTGDLGVLDKEGFLFIRGRSKTMILGPSGQNIYPEEIEDIINESPYVAETLIIEENSKLIALIYPNIEYMEKEEIKPEQYLHVFDEMIKDANKRLPVYSKIFNFRVQEKEFEKTPKRSIKRFLYQIHK